MMEPRAHVFWSLTLAMCAAAGAGCTANESGGSAGAGGAAGAAGEMGQAGAAGEALESFVTVEQWSRDNVTHTMVATVVYREGEAAPLPRIWHIDDHCDYHEGLWSDAGVAQPNHGTTHISGGSGGDLTFGPEGYEAPAGQPSPWTAGDTLTVHADGADLPAFTLVGKVPAVPTLTSHDLVKLEAGEMVVNRTQPLDLTWTPVDGEVFALMLQLQKSTFAPVRGIQCFFPGNQGSGSVPVAALSHFTDPSSVFATNFYFSAAARASVKVNNVSIQMAIWTGRSVRVTIE